MKIYKLDAEYQIKWFVNDATKNINKKYQREGEI